MRTPEPRFFAARHVAIALVAMLSLAGCNNSDPPKFVPEICAEIRSNSGGKQLTMPITGIQYNYAPEPVIHEVDIQDVDLVKKELPNGQQVESMLITMTPAGRRELYRTTVTYQGGHLFLFVNGEPLGVHKIDQPINDGNLQMYIEMPDKDLPAYIKDLKVSVARIQKMKKDR